MILRRVMAHFRKQEWTAIAIDFVIVVIGVFIGLQVQEWSKQRDDRRREAQIIADMLGDLEIDRAQFANGMSADMRGLSAANAAFAGAGLSPVAFDWSARGTTGIDYTFDLSKVSEYPAAPRDMLWTDVVIRSFPTPSTSTYDAMVGAGDIKLIGDRAIVRAIQDYRNRSDSVIAQNGKLMSIREKSMETGAEYGLAPFQSRPAEDVYRLFATEPALAASVRILTAFSIFHYGELKDADAHAAALQERLRTYLESVK